MKESLPGINQYQSIERQKIADDLTVLQNTEGYSLLSERQKQIIRVALYIQARSKRKDSIEETNKFMSLYRTFLNVKKGQDIYRESRLHIEQWYCHGAIAALEAGCFAGEEPEDNPIDFFDAAYFAVNDEYDVKKAIEFFGFPCVVHVNEEKENFKGEDTQYHSFLALGHGEDNKIIVWDKQGFRCPYRVTTLSEVFEEYGPNYFWGVRKLRSNPVIDIPTDNL